MNEIIFKSSDIAMGASLFIKCNKLESVVFDVVSKIGRGLFLNCKSSKNVAFKGVDSIRTDAFRGCISLGPSITINIPKSVTSIEVRIKNENLEYSNFLPEIKIKSWYGLPNLMSAKILRRLYEKAKHLKNCTLYTASWNAFSKVLIKSIPRIFVL